MTVAELIKQLQALPKADQKINVAIEMERTEDLMGIEVKEMGKWVKKKGEDVKVPVRVLVLS